MLGKLETVTPKKIWKNEPDFSRWLALDENLKELGKELEIELCDAQTEVSVGSFSADIIAKEDGGERTIVIENQYGATNHDHLGKLLTYAAGHNAKVLVWIVEDAREEHRAAVQFLNSVTLDEFAFFLVKLNLYRIGESAPAPKFTVVERPNGWSRTMAKTSAPSPHNLSQQSWWEAFNAYIGKARKDYTKVFNLRKPRPQHWMDIALGVANAHLCITIIKPNILSAKVYFPDDKHTFYSLFAHKDEIERKLGFVMEWQPLETKKAAQIKLERTATFADFANASDKEREEAYAWYCETLLKLREVFVPYVRK